MEDRSRAAVQACKGTALEPVSIELHALATQLTSSFAVGGASSVQAEWALLFLCGVSNLPPSPVRQSCPLPCPAFPARTIAPHRLWTKSWSGPWTRCKPRYAERGLSPQYNRLENSKRNWQNWTVPPSGTPRIPSFTGRQLEWDHAYHFHTAETKNKNRIGWRRLQASRLIG